MKAKSLYGMIALGLCAFSVTNSYARIKLITLPVREHVEIQLENEQTTIVEEERIVPLRKGNNDIDFSWHNTSIRPETIVFRVLDDENSIKTNVLSVSYPPNESALTWKVSANQNGSARVRITYAITRLDKNYHYIARANEDESKMDLMQYIKVKNQSGESFLNASMNTGSGNPVVLPMGLDETQEFLNQSYPAVAIDKTYTVNASKLGYRNRAQDKLNVFMHYQLHNDKAHNLGKQSLASGKFRIYQQDKKGTSVFVGEDWGKYTAKENKTSLFIGQARDIVVKRVIERQKRQRINGNLYNIDVLVKYEIENFKDKPVNLTIEESLLHLRNEVFTPKTSYEKSALEWTLGDETSFADKPLKKLTNSQKIAYQITLPARTGAANNVTLVKKLNINFKNEW
ncbi:MAG: hypothetical protein KZQ64_05080 [gamma proteobacterium symbiont of Bathyaustriella thionipta]|nr:hypothetical protein [gamma proteobacterium symbiont of Bathyaustriella thionipta]MCU7950856.1 hypothetical protein [gamma proteobacterium symbiont of Bathyaustriella thionipta]MCU7952751.1 hypothetical protein [gamma proteobacterium symbiont of Bathyaustriella thionipta]MCU7957470.1 hypothetical protein [gamma proteobacterium symbiont of Bathyaustriella thionipta]MCU7968693.1 hypothetical protein [gamma proteobacterium symbiont of Bathyaustriella thionipta]